MDVWLFWLALAAAPIAAIYDGEFAKPKAHLESQLPQTLIVDPGLSAHQTQCQSADNEQYQGRRSVREQTTKFPRVAQIPRPGSVVCRTTLLICNHLGRFNVYECVEE